MNEVIKCIYERRAVRKYRDTPVERTKIDEILAAGKMAPSAMDRQPLKFYVLTKPDMISHYAHELTGAIKKQIAHISISALAKAALSFFHFASVKQYLFSKDRVFYGAPIVILITGPENDEWSSIDAGVCAQNIMLAAKSLGLDTCPIGFARFLDKTAGYEKLAIPQDEQVELAIALGYGDETPVAHKRVTDDIFYL